LYERVFKIAKENGVQQKELAEYLGATKSVLFDWKSGRHIWRPYKINYHFT